MRGRASFLFAVPALLLLCCSVPVVKPGWQDQGGSDLKELQLSGTPAAELSATVKFIPGDNDSNGLSVTVGGDQAAWVAVDPTRLPRVDLGVAYPLTLRVRVPPAAAPGTYNASVKLLTGKKEAGYLPVKIVVQ